MGPHQGGADCGEDLFTAVQEKLASRSPERVPPRVVNCPYASHRAAQVWGLWGGDDVGNGKGRASIAITSARIGFSKAKIPARVTTYPRSRWTGWCLSSLADRVFTASRVRAMLESLRKRLSQSQTAHEGKLKQLTKELDRVQQRSNQLYEAVEKGFLPMDSTLTERANKLQAQRQALLTDMAGLRRLKQMPVGRPWREEDTRLYVGVA